MTRLAFGLCLATLFLPGPIVLSAIGQAQTPAPPPLSRRMQVRLVPPSTFNADVFGDLDEDVSFLLEVIDTVDRSVTVKAGSPAEAAKELRAGDEHRLITHDFVAAHASYERVIALKVDADTTGRAHLGMALTLGAVKSFPLALTSVAEAVRLLPASADAKLVSGLIYILKHDLRAAIPWLRAAAQLDPKSYEAQYWLGFTLLHGDGASDEASLAAFREALRLRPRDTNAAATGVGMAAMKLGYVDDAMNAFEPLIKRTPVNRLAYWFLGLAYLNVNRRADAVALAQKLQTADKKLGDELAKVIADWK